MENLKVKLAKQTVYLHGRRKYWWKIRHKSSSGSEEATDTRIWYTDSKKYGCLIDDEGAGDDKLEISTIEQLDKRRGEMEGPINWQPAEHRITTPEKVERLNKLVDRAEKERRKQEAKKPTTANDGHNIQEEHAHSRPEREEDRSMKPPSIKRVSETEYEIDWGKNVYRQEMAYGRQMNEITRWYRRKHGESEWDQESDKETLKLLETVIAEFKDSESETRKSPEQKKPASRKNPEQSSEQKKPKRPAFAERNTHGGLIIHSLANGSYYTRFDIRKSTKYPRGFTFRMGRGKFYIQETLDGESLAAIEKEISWVLRS